MPIWQENEITFIWLELEVSDLYGDVTLSPVFLYQGCQTKSLQGM